MYVERQRKWIKEVGLRIEDEVLIVAKADTDQAGWDETWVEPMDATIGTVGVIVRKIDEEKRGITVHTVRGMFNYPFFVLVKVEE